MVPDFRRFRLRFVVFFVRIWLANDLEYVILPVPVTLKRFAAPRFVFIFGMLSILSFSNVQKGSPDHVGAPFSQMEIVLQVRWICPEKPFAPRQKQSEESEVKKGYGGDS